MTDNEERSPEAELAKANTDLAGDLARLTVAFAAQAVQHVRVMDDAREATAALRRQLLEAKHQIRAMQKTQTQTIEDLRRDLELRRIDAIEGIRQRAIAETETRVREESRVEMARLQAERDAAQLGRNEARKQLDELSERVEKLESAATQGARRMGTAVVRAARFEKLSDTFRVQNRELAATHDAVMRNLQVHVVDIAARGLRPNNRTAAGRAYYMLREAAHKYAGVTVETPKEDSL